MGLLALLLVGFAVWAVWTGRLQRMSAWDGIMLGLAIIGAILTARGELWGVGPLGVAAAYGIRKSRWRVAEAHAGLGASRSDPDAVAEARALLGLGPDADEDAIRAAHRRLIARTHPDAGGTQALAEKINAARTLLLRHALETKGAQGASTASTR